MPPSNDGPPAAKAPSSSCTACAEAGFVPEPPRRSELALETPLRRDTIGKQTALGVRPFVRLKIRACSRHSPACESAQNTRF